MTLTPAEMARIDPHANAEFGDEITWGTECAQWLASQDHDDASFARTSLRAGLGMKTIVRMISERHKRENTMTTSTEEIPMPPRRKSRDLHEEMRGAPNPDGTILKMIPGTDVEMRGNVTPHAFTPHTRPHIFNQQLVEEIAVGVKLGMNVMFTGPTGCGKTSTPLALASFLGRPVVRFNCDGETRVSHLRGMMKPAAKDGVLSLQFSPGDFATAMRDGWWVILDEFDSALPSVLFVLQPALEEGNRTLHIPETGETVHADPEFMVFATANTVGYRAMARARHAGTNVMNTATIDRFGMVIAVDYPNKEDEAKRIIAHCPELAQPPGFAFVEGICRVSEELRRDEKFKADFSTRRCIQWARLMTQIKIKGKDVPDPLRTAEMSVLRKLESPTDAEVARGVIMRVFGYQTPKGAATATPTVRRKTP